MGHFSLAMKGKEEQPWKKYKVNSNDMKQNQVKKGTLNHDVLGQSRLLQMIKIRYKSFCFYYLMRNLLVKHENLLVLSYWGCFIGRMAFSFINFFVFCVFLRFPLRLYFICIIIVFDVLLILLLWSLW